MRPGVFKLAAAALLAAVSVARAAPAHPDLSGYWELMRAIPAPDPELMAKVAPNTAFLKDAGATEFGPGEFGGLKLTPPALKRAQAWKPQEDMALSKVCRSARPPRSSTPCRGRSRCASTRATG
jgi:hypothetical protein